MGRPRSSDTFERGFPGNMNDSPDTRGKTRSRKRVWIIAGLLILVPVVPM